jgi:hypothetical protein
VNEYGEIEDMHAYDAWLATEQTQRDMQRREEVNINHSHRSDEQDDIEIEGTSDDVDWPGKSAGSAGNYYTDKDNYYVIGSMEERWQGKGEALGLDGKVDKQVFTELLKGKLPDGSDLTRMQDGVNKHRPGYDLTFSAPKSVSSWPCWVEISA